MACWKFPSSTSAIILLNLASSRLVESIIFPVDSLCHVPWVVPVNLTLFLGGLTLGKPLQHTFYGRYYQIRFFYFKPSTLFCQTVHVANVINWVLRQAGKEKLVVWIGVGFVFSWLRSPLLLWYQALTAVGAHVPFCLQSQPYPTCKGYIF